MHLQFGQPQPAVLLAPCPSTQSMAFGIGGPGVGLQPRTVAACNQGDLPGRLPAVALPQGSQHWTPFDTDLFVQSEGLYNPDEMGRKRRIQMTSMYPGTNVTLEVPGRVSMVSPTMSSRREYHEQLWANFQEQTWKDKELIVVETYQSAPSSFLQQKAKEDSRLVYVGFHRNEDTDFNVGLKRNMTLHLASGEFVVNFDDDDVYSARYVESMVGELRARDLVGVTLSSWYNYYVSTGVCGYYEPASWEPAKDEEMDEINYGYGFSYVHRRRPALAMPYPNVDFAEDAPFFMGLRSALGDAAVGLKTDREGLCMHLVHRANSAGAMPMSRELTSEQVRSLAVGPCFQLYLESRPSFLASVARKATVAMESLRGWFPTEGALQGIVSLRASPSRSPQIVGVDVDEVLCQFSQGLMRWQAGNFAFLHDVGECFRAANTKEAAAARSAFLTTEAFEDIEPVRGSLKALEKLSRLGFELHAVTARPESTRAATERYFAKFFPGLISGVHFTRSKGKACQELGAKVYIDDQLPSVKDAVAHGLHAILFDLDGKYTWNRSVDLPNNVVRMLSWDQVVARLLESWPQGAEESEEGKKQKADNNVGRGQHRTFSSTQNIVAPEGAPCFVETTPPRHPKQAWGVGPVASGREESMFTTSSAQPADSIASQKIPVAAGSSNARVGSCSGMTLHSEVEGDDADGDGGSRADIDGLLLYLQGLSSDGARLIEATYVVNKWFLGGLIPLTHQGFALKTSHGEYFSLDFGRNGITWETFGVECPDLPENTTLSRVYTIDLDPLQVRSYCENTKPFSWMNHNCDHWSQGFMQMMGLSPRQAEAALVRPDGVRGGDQIVAQASEKTVQSPTRINSSARLEGDVHTVTAQGTPNRKTSHKKRISACV
eukprot:TRINITY_DN40418_c0_g1_i1.p1 TRINITY_DN40418_c0_g1~~TRINITY_DN40418_c0_g1_i1.p1  ORF type:complete len:889 (-),score=104.09 TRINITY_DN40418_c0_g1_i1:209-2875(-)